MLKRLTMSAGVLALVAGCQADGGYYNQGYNSQGYYSQGAVPQSGYYPTSPAPQSGYYSQTPAPQSGYYSQTPAPRAGYYSPSSNPPQGQAYASRYDGCSDNTAIGTLLGAGAGGLIGNQIGSGGGNIAATIGGIVLGGIAGNAIARDACRNERADAYYYNNAYYDAFDQPQYGRRYEWQNPHSGNYGYVTPMRVVEGGRYGYRNECREFSHVVYHNGQPYGEVNIACRADDGAWRMVSG